MKETEKSRKKVADEVVQVARKVEEMDVQPRKINKLKFQDLPEDVEMYLTEIYPFGNKLFLTGIMDNGQTLNIIAN